MNKPHSVRSNVGGGFINGQSLESIINMERKFSNYIDHKKSHAFVNSMIFHIFAARLMVDIGDESPLF